jgi:atypical dual specificity phosphatase
VTNPTRIVDEPDVEVVSVPWQDRLYAATVFYPTFVWNYLLGRTFKVRRWWDHIDPNVIVGAYPFKRDIEGLFQQGVRAVVNTCEEYRGPTLEYERLGIEQLHIPTTDFTHPRLRDIVLAVEFVQAHVLEGHTVYIHCKAGRARSATVALCWLVKYRGLTVEEAQATLINSRPHINPRLTERPVVRQFAKALETNPEPAAPSDNSSPSHE